MLTFKAWMIVLSASLLVAGCQTTQGNVCDGIEKLTPAPATRAFIITNDRPFAVQAASHNEFGARQGCWGK